MRTTLGASPRLKKADDIRRSATARSTTSQRFAGETLEDGPRLRAIRKVPGDIPDGR